MVCAALIVWAGRAGGRAYALLARGLRLALRVTETLTRATPLILHRPRRRRRVSRELVQYRRRRSALSGRARGRGIGAHVECLPGRLADLALMIGGGLAGVLLLVVPRS